MIEAAIGSVDWVPFCGIIYPLARVAGNPLVCTTSPHDIKTERHLNEETGFSWWDTGETEKRHSDGNAH